MTPLYTYFYVSKRWVYLLNYRIVGQSDPLLVQFSITPLVNQFSNTLQIRITETYIIYSFSKETYTVRHTYEQNQVVPIGHIRLNSVQHVHSCFVDFQKHPIEYLKRTAHVTEINFNMSKCRTIEVKFQYKGTHTCLKRSSCKIFLVFGCIALILDKR